MSCTPLPKAVKPVWANQLTRLPCLDIQTARISIRLIDRPAGEATYIFSNLQSFSTKGAFLGGLRLVSLYKKVLYTNVWRDVCPKRIDFQ